MKRVFSANTSWILIIHARKRYGFLLFTCFWPTLVNSTIYSQRKYVQLTSFCILNKEDATSHVHIWDANVQPKNPSKLLNFEQLQKMNTNSRETNKFQNLRRSFHQQHDCLKSNIDLVTTIPGESILFFSFLFVL